MPIDLYKENRNEEGFLKVLNNQLPQSDPATAIDAGHRKLFTVTLPAASQGDAADYFEDEGFTKEGTITFELDGISNWGRLTTAQETEILSDADAGDWEYNTTLGKFRGHTGSAFENMATEAYVDAAVAVEDLWDRSGTTISPKTADDNVEIRVTSAGAETLPLQLTNIGGSNDGSAVGIVFDTFDGSTPTGKIDNHRYGAGDYALHFGTFANFDSMTLRGGQLGLGTTSPASKLHLQVNESNTTTWSRSGEIIIHNINVTDDSWSGIQFSGQQSNTIATGIAAIYNDTSQNWASMDFSVRGTNGFLRNRLHLASGGNVGIGTDEPDQLLSIAGDAIVGQDVITGLSHLYVGEAVNADQTLVIEYDHDNNLGTLRIGGDASPLGLTVANGGYVGFGTTTPSTNIHVASTTDASIATQYTAAGSFLEMRSGSAKSTIGYDSSEDGLLIGPVAAIRDVPTTGLFLNATGTGIGVAPVTKLHIQANEADTTTWSRSGEILIRNINATDDSWAGIQFSGNASNTIACGIAAIYTDTSLNHAEMDFSVRGTAGFLRNRIRLSSVGYVGINTDTPSVDLHAVGDMIMELGGADNSDSFEIQDSTNNEPIFIADGKKNVISQNLHTPFGGLGRRQNLLRYSEDFSNAAWIIVSGNTTKTSNNATAPNGEQTADTVRWLNVPTLGIRQLVTLTNGATYTVSFWARAVTQSTQTLTVDLGDGGASSDVIVSGYMKRYFVTLTAGSSNWIDLTYSVGAVANDEFEFWGFQINEGSVAYPYCKTEDTAYTTDDYGLTINGDTKINSVIVGNVEIGDQINTPYGGFGRRQNLARYSENLSLSPWIDYLSYTTIVVDNATAPNGELIADTVTWDTPGRGLRHINLGLVNGQTYTVSFWARAVTQSRQTLEIDLGDGIAKSVIISDGYMKRYSVVLTATANDWMDLEYNGTAGDAFEFWGFQVNDGSEPYAYVKTEATAYTADDSGASVMGGLYVYDNGVTSGSIDLTGDITTTNSASSNNHLIFDSNAAGLAVVGDIEFQTNGTAIAFMRGVVTDAGNDYGKVVLRTKDSDGTQDRVTADVNGLTVNNNLDLNLGTNGELNIGANLVINEAGFVHNSASQSFDFLKEGGADAGFSTTDGGNLTFYCESGLMSFEGANVTIDATSVTGGIDNILGTNTSATTFNVKNNSLADLFTVDGSGVATSGAQMIQKGTESVRSNPTNVYDVTTPDELLAITVAMGTPGTFTVNGVEVVLRINSTDTFLTAVNFSVTDGQLDLIINNSVAYAYANVATWMTVSNSSIRMQDCFVVAGVPGTQLLSIVGGSQTQQFWSPIRCTFVSWDLGTVSNIGIIGRGILGVDWTDTLEITDVTAVYMTEIASNQPSFGITGKPMISINTPSGDPSADINLPTIGGYVLPTEALLRFEPELSNNARVLVSNVTLFEGTGELFDTSGTTGPFSAVADATITAESISSVADNGSGLAQFTNDGTDPVYVGQEITISGYVTNTAYNGTFIVTVAGATTFETGVAFGTNEAGGSYDSNSVTITSTAHGLSALDGVTLDCENCIDYDGGAQIYNVQTNTFQVNRTWTQTEAGTWSTEGLDNSDPRIVVENAPAFAESEYIGFAHIQKNAIATTISSADTYQDLNLTGSTGSNTAYATNGAGGTTVTSAAHGLSENQNVVIEGTTNYNGTFRIFNVTAGTYDIPVAFVADDATGTWYSRPISGSSNERFKITNLVTGELTYVGNEPFNGNLIYTVSAFKSGSTETYLFSGAVNGVVEQGAPFQERDITTALGVLPVTVPVQLVYGDTVKPQIASVTTTNSVIIQGITIDTSK